MPRRLQQRPLEIGRADDRQPLRIGCHAFPSRRIASSMRLTTMRNCSRARRRRDATVPSGISSSAAISGDVRSSSSNRTKISASSGIDLGQRQVAQLDRRLLVEHVAPVTHPPVHVLVQLQAHGLAPPRERHAQRGSDQERPLAVMVDVGQALGGDQEGLLRRIGRGVGIQAAPPQRPPDQGVVRVEHPLQAGAVGGRARRDDRGGAGRDRLRRRLSRLHERQFGHVPISSCACPHQPITETARRPPRPPPG